MILAILFLFATAFTFNYLMWEGVQSLTKKIDNIRALIFIWLFSTLLIIYTGVGLVNQVMKDFPSLRAEIGQVKEEK